MWVLAHRMLCQPEKWKELLDQKELSQLIVLEAALCQELLPPNSW